jgi:hypothetical protein
MRLLPFPEEWPAAVHTAISVLAMLALVGAILLFSFAIAGSNHFEHHITKTSSNTWYIDDPNNAPEKWIGQTCATEGKKVLQVQSPGGSYDSLNIVCAP